MRYNSTLSFYLDDNQSLFLFKTLSMSSGISIALAPVVMPIAASGERVCELALTLDYTDICH